MVLIFSGEPIGSDGKIMLQKIFFVSSKTVKTGGPWCLARAPCTSGASHAEQNKKVTPEEVHYALWTH